MSGTEALTVRTAPFEAPSGTAIDPLVCEITWQAWELTGADPGRASEEAVRALTMGFDCIVETVWKPGSSLVLSEVCWDPELEGGAGVLTVRLAVGLLGPAGTTRAEAAGIVPRVAAAIAGGGVFAARAIDPAVVVPSIAGEDIAGAESPFGSHAALVRQSQWTMGDDVDLMEIVSRFAPTVEPWNAVVSQVAAADQPIRVRATVLATELSPADRLELSSGLARVRAVRERNPDRGEVQFDADRAEATLLDLRASFASPLLVGEIAVSSQRSLADTLLRSLAGAFTSQSDVLRQQGRIVVASNRLVLGGYEVDRDPRGWMEAHRLGVPLRGGLRPRALRDLLTLTESPIGWPVPFGQTLPSIPGRLPSTRVPPAALRSQAGEVTVIGTGADMVDVVLPVTGRTRHVVVTGAWGAGKSTVLFHHALADLRAGRPFLLVDPHGTMADLLVPFARALGRDPVVIDPLDGGTQRMRPLPRLRRDDANRPAVEAAIRVACDAVASSLPNVEWTGPRWFASFGALLDVVVAHEGELVDAAVWLNDPNELRKRLSHPRVSRLARSTLENLIASSSGDGADVRGWVSSKLHPLVSGVVRRILAPIGKGVDLAAAAAAGRPVIVSLAGLSTSEAALVGHLALAGVLDAALQSTHADRPLITCYIDEAHRFPARGLSRVLVEGRKFGIGLVVATQSLGQLSGELADLAMGAGTQIAFRATPDTATRLSAMIDVPARELVSLPDLHAVVAVLGHPAASVSVPPYEASPVERRKTAPRNRRTARPVAPLAPAPIPTSAVLDDFLQRRGRAAAGDRS